MKLVLYVDVDDTFVRSAGSKRIPMPRVVSKVRALHDEGVEMFCWSSGGADYARRSAEEFGLEDCFAGFLPKPNVVLDDQSFEEWRNLLILHPNEVATCTADQLRARLFGEEV